MTIVSMVIVSMTMRAENRKIAARTISKPNLRVRKRVSSA